MADVTGTLHHTYGGKSFTMRLTWGVLAALQARHGNDFLSRLDVGAGSLPEFALLIDIAALALAKGEGIHEDQARDIADDMLTADPGLIQRLIASAFPDAVGNVEGAAGKAA